MKINIFKKELFFISIVIFSTSCTNDIDNIIEHKNEIISFTKNQEISVDEYNKNYYLYTNINNKESENLYYFKRRCIKKFLFCREYQFVISFTKIQSKPDNIIKPKENIYFDDVCSYYQRLSQKLLEYNIKYISHSRSNDYYITIFLENGNILIYYPNMPKEDEKLFFNFKKKTKDWFLYDGPISR